MCTTKVYTPIVFNPLLLKQFMTIEFLHEDQPLTAVVTFNLHNTNILMVKLRTPVETISEVIFLINTGQRWISDSPMETMFPLTYNNLIAQINNICIEHGQQKEKCTECLSEFHFLIEQRA